jgi:hypothetical protein
MEFGHREIQKTTALPLSRGSRLGRSNSVHPICDKEMKFVSLGFVMKESNLSVVDMIELFEFGTLPPAT